MLLDATNVSDEQELQVAVVEQSPPATAEVAAEATMATAGPVRKITLQLPPECETSATLLIQRWPDGIWRSGYIVSFGKKKEELQPRNPDEDNGFEKLSDAVAEAVEYVNWFISTSAADDDPAARLVGDLLDSYLAEITDVTPAVFDDATEAEKAEVATASAATAATDKPAEDDADILEMMKETLQREEGRLEREQVDPAKEVEPVYEERFPICDPAANTGVTDEAQRHFDTRKHELESAIGQLSIEEARLKAAIKINREKRSSFTEDLEKHLAAGPERLPLFDRKAAVESSDASTEAAKPIEPVAADPDAWRQATIASIGLSEKIVEILSDLDIRTLGDWVDVPLKRGCEYTQLKGITEKRLEKISEAMMKIVGDAWRVPFVGSGEESPAIAEAAVEIETAAAEAEVSRQVEPSQETPAEPPQEPVAEVAKVEAAPVVETPPDSQAETKPAETEAKPELSLAVLSALGF